MIKRILMTAAVLGGLCGVSLYADTFIVGVENNSSAGDPTEGIGDFNDLMLQFGASGLTTVSGSSWSTFNGGVVTHDRLSNSSSAFWANNSLDTPNSPHANTQKNIGYCLTTTNCDVSGEAAVNEYLGNNNPAGDFYFTFGGGSVSTIQLGAITPNAANESIGIYNTANAGQIQWIIQNGVNVAGSSITPDWNSFGLVFIFNGNVYYSQNSLGAYVGGNYTTTGVPDNRFALFSLPDATGVPEPGTMALFGLGALALGLTRRFSKRS